jgi:hypothetical protein
VSNENRQKGDLTRNDTGFFLGFGSGSFGVLGVRTANQDIGATIRNAGTATDLSLSYYSIDSDRLAIFQDQFGTNPYARQDWMDSPQAKRRKTSTVSHAGMHSFDGNLDMEPHKGIMRWAFSGGQNMAGGSMGFENDNMLLRAGGYSAWGLDGGIDNAKMYGVEGELKRGGPKGFAQYRQFGDREYYAGGLRFDAGKYAVQVSGYGSVPRTAYQSYFTNYQPDLQQLSSAYSQLVRATTSKDKRDAQANLQRSMENFFQQSDNFSVLRDLQTGAVNEVTVAVKNTQGGLSGMVTLSAVRNQAGDITNYLSSFIDFGSNLAVLSTFDTKPDARSFKAAGGLLTFGNFKTLMVVEKTGDDKLLKEAKVGLKGDDWQAMASAYSTDNLYHISLNVGTRSFDGAVVLTHSEKDNAKYNSIGSKAAFYFNQMRLALSYANERFEDAVNGNLSGEQVFNNYGVELGRMGENAYWGIGGRLVEGGVNDWQVYGTLRLRF